MTAESTRVAYCRRAVQLRAAAARALKVESGTDAEVVQWLIDAKWPHLSASSLRQYRAAMIYSLNEGAREPTADIDEIYKLVRQLNGTSPSGHLLPKRTSATKQKKLPPDDFKRILLKAKASRSDYKDALGEYLFSGRLTGLRPCEWAEARLEANPLPGFEWSLTARCAKFDDERGISEFRTLYFVSLRDHHVVLLKNWLRRVQAAVAQGGFDKLLKALSDFLYRITREIFPRRKTFPTLYSTRHEAAARFKAAYIDARSNPREREEGHAIVAALLGHVSDETATQHYGRARRGGVDFPVPEPDPAALLLVRRRLAESRSKQISAMTGRLPKR